MKIHTLIFAALFLITGSSCQKADTVEPDPVGNENADLTRTGYEYRIVAPSYIKQYTTVGIGVAVNGMLGSSDDFYCEWEFSGGSFTPIDFSGHNVQWTAGGIGNYMVSVQVFNLEGLQVWSGSRVLIVNATGGSSNPELPGEEQPIIL